MPYSPAPYLDASSTTIPAWLDQTRTGEVAPKRTPVPAGLFPAPRPSGRDSGNERAYVHAEAERAERDGDEGEVQMAQLLLLARASTLIGTLTSNYLLLAYDMGVWARHHAGEAPPGLVDLDGNAYYPCSVSHTPPWGPRFGNTPEKRKRRIAPPPPEPPPPPPEPDRIEL